MTSAVIDLSCAARILGGEALELYEFPIAPSSIANHAVLRRHTAPQSPSPGLELVLADASAPPFLPGSFDLVLTPWFVDVAGEPISRVAQRISTLLARGGHWINHGSLAFADGAPADALSLEELLEQLPALGFDPINAGEARLP